MTNISLNISDKINPEHQKVIRQLKQVLDQLGIPFFIIGASARDFVVEYLHDIESPRMTLDIDFAVRIDTWQQYDLIHEALLKVPGFKKTNQKQRFECGDTIIDIVPFGQVSDKGNVISWPPEHDVFMCVSGFEDAFKYSIKVQIAEDPDLEIKVPTIPGMVLMKLISWDDAGHSRPKDAQDVYFLALNYKNTDVVDRLFIENHELFVSEGYDDQMASIRLLGQDMARICHAETKNTVTEILTRETSDASEFRLILDMVGRKYDFDDVLAHMQKLKQGLEEG